MNLNRRNFVELTAGAGLLSILPGCKSTPGKLQAVSHTRQVSLEELEKVAEASVLRLDGLDSPLVIESIELLRKGWEYIVRVRSKDGAEGVAVTNSRPDYLQPILNKLVIACVLGIGCSGAYYIACGCDGTIAQPSGVVGNIGTIFQTYSVAGTMEKIGIKAVTIKSGKLKDMASPLHDLSDEEHEVLQGIIEQFSEQFFEVVHVSRTHMSLEKDSPEHRSIQKDGKIVSKPILGGLHHVYSRVA